MTGRIVPDNLIQKPPEAPASPLRYGEFWIRFFAAFIDLVVIALIWDIIFTIFFMAYHHDSFVQATWAVKDMVDRIEQSDDSKDLSSDANYFLLAACGIMWLYYTLLESSFRSATVGKRICRLKVVDMKGKPIGFWRAATRSLARLFSIFIYFIGFVLAAGTAKKQTLHDLVARTLVVIRDK